MLLCHKPFLVAYLDVSYSCHRFTLYPSFCRCYCVCSCCYPDHAEILESWVSLPCCGYAAEVEIDNLIGFPCPCGDVKETLLLPCFFHGFTSSCLFSSFNGVSFGFSSFDGWGIFSALSVALWGEFLYALLNSSLKYIGFEKLCLPLYSGVFLEYRR